MNFFVAEFFWEGHTNLQKIEEISTSVLTLLINVKTRGISSNFVAVSEHTHFKTPHDYSSN